MKVDTMRKVDYYFGVPLCALLSCFNFILNLFRSKSKTIKNVLFIELSEMGSAILVDPSMRHLKEQNKKLHFVIFKKNKASLNLLKTIPEDNIYTINPDGLFNLAWSSFKFLLWCRKKNIDTVIDLELFSRFTALLTALCGAKNRVGFYRYHQEGLYRGNFLTHKVPYNPYHHISKNFMSLVKTLDLNPKANKEEPLLKYDYNEATIKLAKQKEDPEKQKLVAEKIHSFFPELDLQDIINKKVKIALVNANASDLLPQRRWPKAHFTKWIESFLNKYPDYIVLLTGAPAEKKGLDDILTPMNKTLLHKVKNFAGAVSFSELTSLYYLSSFMLSNDSGPPHFASVTDLHTFVLFGPETPKMYSSIGPSTAITLELSCSPCVSAWNHRKTPCTNNICLKNLTPKMVLNKVDEFLKA